MKKPYQQSASFTCAVFTAVRISVIPIGDRYAAVRKNVEQLKPIDSRAEQVPTTSVDYICTKEDAAAMFSGTIQQPTTRVDWRLLTPEDLSKFNSEILWYGASECLMEKPEHAAGKWYDLAVKMLGEGSDLRLVRLDHSSHMLFDEFSDSLPVAKRCCYIDGEFHDGKYDLVKVLKKLELDSRVAFTHTRAAIYDIPSYNVNSESSKYISFTYFPRPADESALWQKQLSYGGKYPSTDRFRAMHELDIFGINEFLKDSYK